MSELTKNRLLELAGLGPDSEENLLSEVAPIPSPAPVDEGEDCSEADGDNEETLEESNLRKVIRKELRSIFDKMNTGVHKQDGSWILQNRAKNSKQGQVARGFVGPGFY